MKKITLLWAFFLLAFALTACSGSDKNDTEQAATVATDIPITLSVPADVVSELGYFKIRTGDDLTELIRTQHWTNAYWEPDGTLKIETTEENCSERFDLHKKSAQIKFDAFLYENSSDYLFFLYDIEVADDFTSVAYIVNKDGYEAASSTVDTYLAVAATSSMGLCQLYSNVSTYNGTVSIIDYDTGEVIVAFTWPEVDFFLSRDFR